MVKLSGVRDLSGDGEVALAEESLERLVPSFT